MDRITVKETIEFAEKNFPYAPEELVRLLEIEVWRTPLNCDGWCLEFDGKAIITINDGVSVSRQKFTLAHELGHYILGIPSIVGESTLDNQNLMSNEEKLVNELAGHILLPLNIIKNFIPEIPITASTIKKIAKRAKISEVAVARRLAFTADELGLKEGVVLHYESGVLKWHWSKKFKITANFADKLFAKCLEESPLPLKVHIVEKKDVLVACMLENPTLNTITIFLQIVDEEIGLKTSNEELKKELEKLVFENAGEFRNRLQGYFSAIKLKAAELSLDNAVELFNETYLQDSSRWNEEFWNRLKSDHGQRYIRLRLKEWAKK